MRNSFSAVFGAALVLFGAIFLLDNLGYIGSSMIFDNFWPIVLILLGIAIITRTGRSKWHEQDYQRGWQDSPPSTGKPSQDATGDYVSESQVFGDIHRQNSSKNFSGGHCSVVFGDIRLDLTQTDFLEGERILRISSVFGSVRVDLPANLEFCVRADCVAGSMQIKGDRRGGLVQKISVQSDGYVNASKRLLIHASSVFGEIKVF
jgi:predicted membrane protein